MSFACIHLPNLPLQAVVRNEPELRARSVAITEGKSEAVMAANQAARQAGVQLGMIRLQVVHLPSLEIRPRSRAQEEAARAALLDLSFSFSPRVEDTAADALTLDLQGLERVLGSPRAMAQKMTQGALELGLDVNVAIAPNPDAALLAARGFAGITIVDPAYVSQCLGPLPVSILSPPEEILETLNRWGIRTLSALAVLPTEQLSERLGQPGVRLQQLARGTWQRSPIPVQPSLRFEETMELEYEERQLEPLLFLLGRLLGNLCARLTARGLAAQELRLNLELAPGEEQGVGNRELGVAGKQGIGSRELGVAENRKQGIESRESGIADKDKSLHPSRLPTPDSPLPSPDSLLPSCHLPLATSHYSSLRLPVPMRDPRTLLKLLQLNLSAKPPSAAVHKISIAAEPAKPRAMQGGLFAPIAPDPEKLEITLARIGAIVGAGNSGSAELLDTHRPSALRMAKFNPGKEQGVGSRELGLGNKAEGSRQSAEGSGKQKAEGGKEGIENRELGVADKDKRFHPSLLPTPYSRLPSLSAYCLLPTAYCSLRLFRPPLPAEVATNGGGTPVRVFFSGIKGEVISAAGPWRSSGDWWTEGAWRQDEWDVEIEMRREGNREWGIGNRGRKENQTLLPIPYSLLPSKAVYRIYRDAASGQWFVRGYYD